MNPIASIRSAPSTRRPFLTRPFRAPRAVWLACALGLPLLATASGDDAPWDRRFSLPFLNGTVTALAASGDDLYVGGTFTVAGAALADQGIAVNHLFRWRDGHPTPLGTGLNGAVHAIAFHEGDVYVGGTFTRAGGAEANRLAKWDGQTWSPVGGGVDGTVYALMLHEGELYVGGQFTTAGGVTVHGVGRWNGSAWSALGGGVGASGTVRSLAFWQGHLYAGGLFFLLQTLGGPPVLITHLARWNGESWSAVGASLDHQVKTLLADGPSLYVGGMFTAVGGVTVNKLARWDGESWSAVGGGLSAGVTDAVHALALIDGQLYAGGQFTTASGIPANAVARWDGTAWSALGEGVVNTIGGVVISPATVASLAVTGGQLHVGGAFNRAGPREAVNLATWHNGAWRAHGLGLSGPAYAIHPLGQDVLVGGSFPSAGGVPVNSIARWNNDDWAPLGGGVRQDPLSGQVHALAVRGTDVYAGGVFNRAGEVAALNVAHWNGTTWAPLGAGLGGNGAVVRALAVGVDGTLYAGGFFTAAGNVRAIARWDGVTWSALGGGLNATPGLVEVRALATLGNDLYAGGAFTSAGGIPTRAIARWNGSAWSAVGEGLNQTVLALTTDGDNLYAAGYFTLAGGVPAQRVARWNGSAWSALGEGIGTVAADFVHALAVDGGRLYAGGVFTSLGNGAPAAHIAAWDGNTWSPLGSGTALGSPPAVYGLAARPGRLHVAGTFGQAGGVHANGFAIWADAKVEIPQSQLSLAQRPDGSRLIRFVGPAGRDLQIWSTSDLNEPFTPASAILPGTGAESTYEDHTPAGNSRYYQLRVLP